VPRQVTFGGSGRVRFVGGKDAGRRHSRSYAEDEDAASGESGRRGTSQTLPDEALPASLRGIGRAADHAVVPEPGELGVGDPEAAQHLVGVLAEKRGRASVEAVGPA